LYPDDLFLASKRYSLELLPSLKQMAKEDTLNYPFVKYFAISEYPFNVYQVYEQIKTTLRTILMLPAKDIYIHVAIKLNMQDLLMVGQVRHQCSLLGSLVNQIAAGSPCPVHLSFSCMYNIFGIVHSTVMHMDSNSVQTLLYLLKASPKHLVVPYGKNEEVIGTDVEDAVSRLLQWADAPGPDEPLRILPINTPVTAMSLMQDISMAYPEKYAVKFSEKAHISLASVVDALQCKKLDVSISDRFQIGRASCRERVCLGV